MSRIMNEIEKIENRELSRVVEVRKSLAELDEKFVELKRLIDEL